MRMGNSEDKHDHSDEDSDEDKIENNNRLRLRGLKIRVYNHMVEFRKNRKLVVSI